MSESCVVFNDGDLSFTVKCTSIGKTGKEVLKNLLLDADAEGADCFFREDEGATREKFLGLFPVTLDMHWTEAEFDMLLAKIREGAAAREDALQKAGAAWFFNQFLNAE